MDPVVPSQHRGYSCRPCTRPAFSSTLDATESDWKRSIPLKSNNIAHMADSWQNSQELQTQVIAEYSMHCNTYSTIYVCILNI